MSKAAADIVRKQLEAYNKQALDAQTQWNAGLEHAKKWAPLYDQAAGRVQAAEALLAQITEHDAPEKPEQTSGGGNGKVDTAAMATETSAPSPDNVLPMPDRKAEKD